MEEVTEANLLTDTPSPALGTTQWSQLYQRDKFNLEANCADKGGRLERGGPSFLVGAWRNELEAHLWVIGYDWNSLDKLNKDELCELADNPYGE
ncbi:MAG: hypothetical protein ACI88C_000073 [Acidimicrobiales bacterium]|jgi:hypothetical protein